MTGANWPADGVALARLACDAIGVVLKGRELGGPGVDVAGPDGLGLDAMPPPGSPLWEPGASFVTIERAGALRGCVGTIAVSRPLCLDVVRNAEGATRDPRLPPVTLAEWPELDVKVSVLSALEPLDVAGPADLADALRPGVDGVLLAEGDRRATFLPSVWHKVGDPRRFIGALLAKGGWPAGQWPAGMRVSRYSCAEYVDRAPRRRLPR